MLTGLAHSIFRPEKRSIGLSLGSLGLSERLCGSMDRWVSGTAV